MTTENPEGTYDLYAGFCKEAIHFYRKEKLHITTFVKRLITLYPFRKALWGELADTLAQYVDSTDARIARMERYLAEHQAEKDRAGVSDWFEGTR